MKIIFLQGRGLFKYLQNVPFCRVLADKPSFCLEVDTKICLRIA